MELGAFSISLSFEKNMLTFSPGWDSSAQPLDPFTDVRELQRRLKAQSFLQRTA